VSRRRQGPIRTRPGGAAAAVDFSRTIGAMPADPAALPAWLAALAARAPDLVAPFAAPARTAATLATSEADPP